MFFSPLQKYILKECYGRKGRKIDRKLFVDFYAKKSSAKKDSQAKIITKSIERLIDREILIGYGIRTTNKWFIKEVKMVESGRKKWREYLNRKQKKLPL
jgi:hypothetical protein